MLAGIVLLATVGAGLPIFIKVIKNMQEKRKNNGQSFTDQIEEAQTFDSSTLEIKIADDNKQDYEVIAACLTYAKGSMDKVSRLLEIPATTLETIYHGKGEYALKVR